MLAVSVHPRSSTSQIHDQDSGTDLVMIGLDFLDGTADTGIMSDTTTSKPATTRNKRPVVGQLIRWAAATPDRRILSNALLTLLNLYNQHGLGNIANMPVEEFIGWLTQIPPEAMAGTNLRPNTL